MRRVPLWTTLIPLAIGIGGYWLIWQKFSAQFADELAKMMPSEMVNVSGFPYRLEAVFDSVTLQARSDGFKTRFDAKQMVFNQGPWQPDLTVMRSIDAKFDVSVADLTDAHIAIRAPTAEVSLRQTDGKIARLSMVFNMAALQFGGLRAPVHAGTFELHVREQSGSDIGKSSARLPVQIEGVIRAAQFGFDSGSPLNLSVAFTVDGKAPLRSYIRWIDGGTVEIDSLKLADSYGEILDARATIAPTPSGTLRINGTLTTACPATVRAAFIGGPGPMEMRLRTPVQLAFGGDATRISIDPPAGDFARLSRRGQLPPCPILRR